ncbi:hypothetical protein D3C85_1670320 [compost metagenome]
MIHHITEFERMPYDCIRTVGQAVDLGLILPVDMSDFGRYMTHGPIFFNYNACRNLVRINLIRNGNRSFHIRIEIRYFHDFIVIDRSHCEVQWLGNKQ